jgi:hypothetical protein
MGSSNEVPALGVACRGGHHLCAVISLRLVVKVVRIDSEASMPSKTSNWKAKGILGKKELVGR